MIAGQERVEDAIDAIQAGADAYLVTPVQSAEAAQLLQAAVARRAERTRSIAEARQPSHALVGRSTAMRSVYKRIGRAAGTDLPVLVEGGSGTGKEVVARAIHAASSRAAGPFVIVRLAGQRKDLIEKELYGGTEGAGAFERADRGTLVLDHISEMPVDLQPTLLHTMQSHLVTPVGSDRTRRIDVRVIAITSGDLPSEVADGTFQAELYYQLSVIQLRMPTLAERFDDLALLAGHFAYHQGLQLRGKEMEVSETALELLSRQRWPGNVRELENTIRIGVLAAAHDVVTAEHIATRLADTPSQDGLWERFFADRVRECLGHGPVWDALVTTAERIVLREALASAGGNQVRAAGLLGLHRSALRRRIQRTGLELTPDTDGFSPPPESAGEDPDEDPTGRG
jgi:two-component system nitrogen regulation response regulator GlnG